MKFSGSKSQGCLAMIIRDFRKRHHSCDGKGKTRIQRDQFKFTGNLAIKN